MHNAYVVFIGRPAAMTPRVTLNIAFCGGSMQLLERVHCCLAVLILKPTCSDTDQQVA